MSWRRLCISKTIIQYPRSWARYHTHDYKLLGVGIRLDGDPNQILIWGEFGHQIALLEDTKTVIRRKLTSWIRRAILRTLIERCDNDRRDMCGITCYIDRNATLANFTSKSAEMPYSSDDRMRHVLRSIIAGSIRARDRLISKDHRRRCMHMPRVQR